VAKLNIATGAIFHRHTTA